MNEEALRAFAADLVCATMAARRDDSGDVLVNAFGFDEFPPDVREHEQRIGPHIFYPMNVLASFAARRPIPPREESD